VPMNMYILGPLKQDMIWTEDLSFTWGNKISPNVKPSAPRVQHRWQLGWIKFNYYYKLRIGWLGKGRTETPNAITVKDSCWGSRAAVALATRVVAVGM
jgi:hypothetical protein